MQLLIIIAPKVFFIALFVLAWSITDVIIEMEEYKRLKKQL